MRRKFPVSATQTHPEDALPSSAPISASQKLKHKSPIIWGRQGATRCSHIDCTELEHVTWLRPHHHAGWVRDTSHQSGTCFPASHCGTGNRMRHGDEKFNRPKRFMGLCDDYPPPPHTHTSWLMVREGGSRLDYKAIKASTPAVGVMLLRKPCIIHVMQLGCMCWHRTTVV